MNRIARIAALLFAVSASAGSEFHIEGFVNQYALEERGNGRFVFASEAIENVAPGFRARVTVTVTSPDTFDEVFRLAPAGKEFELYQKNQWTRVKGGR